MQALRQDGFAVEAPARRQALATGLLGCLGDPDPGVRDAIAYEALSAWMRADVLPAPELQVLRERLYAMLDGPDQNGFRRPFAALILSEVARTDRVAPWMSDPERDAMVTRAVAYVTGVEDYRGYDPAQGWRHGIAHGADWLMQLAMNPKMTRGQLDRILDAVASQVVPAAHAYVFGEPQRLARPLLFVARRGLHDDGDWQAWFDGLGTRLGDPTLAYRDRDWLLRRHDLNAFLDAVYVEVDSSDEAALKPLLPPVLAAMKALP